MFRVDCEGYMYEGPDWTKIKNLVFVALFLHYDQNILQDEPIEKLGRTKIKSKILFSHHNKQIRNHEEWKIGSEMPG